MKKTIITIFTVLLVFLVFTGCEKKESEEATTPAAILSNSFVETIAKEKDISVVAKKLSENEVIKTKIVVEEKTKEDFLSGFDEKITKYNKAYVIQPMVGSIPFVAYVFESDEPKELEKELNASANPRWNICVEADETMVKVVDNYVFFVMAPKSFEE